jgi:hypothetical protein
MSVQLKPVFSSYDESLNKAHKKNYHLTIQLSLDGFSFTIFDTLVSKFLSFETVELGSNGNPAFMATQLKDYLNGHEWLGDGFAGTTILFETSRSTLIPAPLYNPADQDLLARFNFKVEEGMITQHDHLPNADAYLVYAIPGGLATLLAQLFPGHVLRCHASVFIEELLILNKNLPASKRMFANVRKTWLDIAITEGKQLLFYNAFPYHSDQDFIYYIIFVIEQLNLNPEEIDLKLSGRIDKQSTLFDMAWKYIRNIHFQELSADFKYSYLFSDIPAHYHFTLLNSELCES